MTRATQIRGLGVRSALGNSLTSFWNGLVSASNLPTPYRPDGSTTATRPVEVHAVYQTDFSNDEASFSESELRRFDRSQLLSIAAAQDALGEAAPQLNPARTGIVVGTGFGGWSVAEKDLRHFFLNGTAGLSPMTIPLAMPSSIAAALSMRFGFRGPTLTISTACASGSMAIGEAAQLIRQGRCDAVLAGGVDALVLESIVTGFGRLRALSRIPAPEGPSRPFSNTRDGFVLADGAAFLLLTAENVVDDEQPLYGSILGYGTNSDAYHLVAPSPDGIGAVECIRLALSDADVSPPEVGHVNAHGTSTGLNDAAEASALATVFGPCAVPVAATKALTGHSIGGSGAIEAVASLLTIQERAIPAAPRWSDDLDESLKVDLVLDKPRTLPTDIVLSNSFGFGGVNAALVLKGP